MARLAENLGLERRARDLQHPLDDVDDRELQFSRKVVGLAGEFGPPGLKPLEIVP